MPPDAPVHLRDGAEEEDAAQVEDEDARAVLVEQGTDSLANVGQCRPVIVVEQRRYLGVPEGAHRFRQIGVLGHAGTLVIDGFRVQVQVLGHRDVKGTIGPGDAQDEAALVFVDFNVFHGPTKVGHVFDQAVQGSDIAQGGELRWLDWR